MNTHWFKIDENQRKRWAVDAGIGITLPCGTPSAAKPKVTPASEPASELKPKRSHHKQHKRRKRKSLEQRFPTEGIAPSGFVAEDLDLGGLRLLLPERAESLLLLNELKF
jgi:hypothetical protein